VQPARERPNTVDEQLRRRLREQELACFGRVGADVSHDLRNVLAIIGENAGLLDDLLAAAGRGKPLDRERLKRISSSITRQVKGGTETMERFSRFAHATDHFAHGTDVPSEPVDLAAAAGNTAALVQRQVRLAGCSLQVELPDRAVLVRANPLAVRLLLECLEDGAAATIKLAAAGPTAVLSVSGRAASDSGGLAGPVTGLTEVLEELGGKVETSREGGIVSLILTIPTQSTAR
jgi:hypothetical protein